MTTRTCTVYLSTETVCDDPILALKQALRDLPFPYIEAIIAVGTPRYNASTHAIEFYADVEITAPQITIRTCGTSSLPREPEPQRIHHGE